MAETHRGALARNWVVTGTSSGLGASLAAEIVRRGDTLFGLVRNTADAEKIEALGRKGPGTAHAVIGDVTDETHMAQKIGALEENGYAIDVAVNNAGYGLLGTTEEVSDAEIRALFDVNVFGALNVIRAVLPGMRARRGGHIINITSVSGHAAWAGTSAYTASKFALEGLGQTLHQETAELGINVTNVAPGALRTRFGLGSLKTAERSIDDYDGAGHMPRQRYSETAGKEDGDPDRAANAIYEITREANPPMHLLLGADAVKYLEAEQSRLNREVSQFMDLTLSIAFPDGGPDN